VILGLTKLFAVAEGGPAVHITPGEVFQIQGISITNSMLYGAISTVVILFLVIIAARRSTIQPKKGFVQFIEIGTEFIIGLLESNIGDRTKAIKYAPYFVSLFFYIMLTNWLGLLPFVGEGFVSGETPLFRPFTADLNGTLAAATITIIMVQIFAIKESGLAKHARHYFAGSLKNPMTYLMGGFELFGELTRIISLALRLFLNVAIGEIIIAVFSYLGQAGAPITALPFYILELLVGALQAYIFVMLSVVYLAIAIKHDHDESHSEEYESVHTISEAKA
jgi:F-type H+-transporting ATPase subunit a